jgi:hypothetical protein
MDEYKYKKESTIILGCILIILIFYCLRWIITSINNSINKYMKNSILTNNNEMFSNNNSSNGSKREMMKKIYRSDEVLDPDDIIMDNFDYDECDDPDGSCGVDPDNTPLMNSYKDNDYVINYTKYDDVCDFYNNYCNNI